MGLQRRWKEITGTRSFQEFYFFAVALVLAFGIIQTSGTLLETERAVVSVVSCSMYPQLHVGDILVVRGVEYESISEGDIIVFSNPEMEIPVVHRVIEKNPKYLQTKGDNNKGQLDFEKNVTPDQVYGKILFRIPRVGGLKLLAMDIAGLNDRQKPDRPILIDSYPACEVRVPMDQRP